MKTLQINRLARISKAGVLTLALLAASKSALSAANINWNGSTSSYNTPGSWIGGVVPGPLDNAINDNSSNNVVQINSGDPDWTVNQVRAGNSTGDGAFSQNGQTLTLVGTNNGNGYTTPFRLGVAAGMTGIYTMSGGSINYSNGGFNVGELGTGILTLSGGTITGSGNAAINLGSVATPVSVTATVGGGTGFGDFTFFEQGYFAPNPGAGVPAAGSPVTSVAQPSDHFYAMPPTYTGNNVVMVANNLTTATITTPSTVCSGLSFMCTSGNGASTVNYTVHHADTTVETGTLTIPDWFGPGTAQEVMAVAARVDALGVNVQQPGVVSPYVGNAPYIWSLDITLANTTSAVTSVDLTWVSGGVANFFGVSSSTGGAFNPLAITGYNKDVITEATAQNVVANTVLDLFTQTGGTLNITGGGQFFVGNYGNGLYNFSGGTNTEVNFVAIGRSGGSGTVNMSGGEWDQTGSGNNFLVGTGFQAPAGSTPVGILNQTGGAISCQGQFLCPENSPSSGFYNLTNGTLTVNNWIAFGRNSGAGTLNMAGGTITKTGGSGNHIVIGAGGTGIINQSGGYIISTASDTWIGENGAGTWNLNGGTNTLSAIHIAQTSGNGTLNLNGGLLNVGEITTGNPASVSILNFNGTVVQASVSTVTFLHDIFTASIQPGGAIFDSQGFDITITEPLADGGGGGVMKLGSGSLTLAGANTYGGPTVVGAGKIIITSDSAGGGDVTVGNGAAFSVIPKSLNAQYTVPNATFVSTASTFNTDLGSFGNPSSAPFNITGNLTVNGTVTVNVADSVPAAGQIPLIKYTTRSGAGSFVLGSLPSGSVGFLSNNVANASIDLVITSAGAPRWDGTVVGGVWDINTTANWFDLGTSATSTYHDGTPVLFNDAAAGTTNVNLTVTVTPGSLTFNDNTLGYVISGSGKITGATGLTKIGAATVSLLNTGGNNFTGPVTLSGGILAVTSLANGGSPSAIGASSASATNLVFNGGTLSYSGTPTTINRNYSVTASGGNLDAESDLTISGLASAATGAPFIKSGPATLTYSGTGTNNLTGTGFDYLVTGGTVVFNGSAGGQTNALARRLNVGGIPGVNASVVVTNATMNIVGIEQIGNSNNATASLTLNNGAIYNANGSPMIVADSGGITTTTGSLVQNNGILNISGELWVGQNVNGVGSYTFSAGTNNIQNWLAIGRFGGTGVWNMTGGVMNKNGSAMITGTGAGNNSLHSTGTFNFSGGTITSSSEMWIAENTGTEGTNNISGTAVLNLNNWMSIGRGGHGVLNFSGGTINHNGGTAFIIGDGGNAYMNHTGGSLTTQKELWIAQAGTSVGRYDMSGTASTVVNNWIAVGRGGSGANGTLNMMGGTLTKTGNSGNHITLGSGGTGTVNQSGGTITSTASSTFIGESQPGTWNMNGGSAVLALVNLPLNNNVVGNLNLNGGTFSTTEIAGNQSGKGTLTFNGGTLVAASGASANFLHNVATNLVLAGGAVINSGGNSIGVATPLLDGTGGGGLTKVGNGTLYLNATNTYTGVTLVSTGALGGAGIIVSPVLVSNTASLSPGNAGIGTFTVSNTVTLLAGSTTWMEVSKTANTSDLLRGMSTVNYAGTLVVSNLSAAFTGGESYKLFDATTYNGSFSAIVPATPGPGLAWNTSQLAVSGTISVVATTTVPLLTATVSGGNLNVSWPSDHLGYTLQIQTNALSKGLGTNWVAVPNSTTTTNVAVPLNPANGAVFLRLVP